MIYQDGTLKSIATERGVIGGPFGSSLGAKDYVEAGVPVIRGTNLGHGRYIGGDYVYVTQEKLERELARNVALAGDVVFTQRGTLGQVSLVPDDADQSYVISQSQMRLRVDKERAFGPFVYYACSAAGFLKQIDDNAIATGVPHVNLGILGRLVIPLPPLPEQRAIAEVLGALDDKIAANTKLADAADRFIRAEFLSLPYERNVAVSELATARREQVDPTEVRADLQYVGLEHIPRRSMWLADQGYASDVTSAKSRFRSGDVLFGKLRPYFHKVVSASSDGICSTDVIVVTACQAALQGAVLAAVSSDAVVEAVTSMSEGTRMPRTSWKDLASVEVPWPNDLVAHQFSDRVVGIRGAVESKLRENRTLAATRDALLPQLMSGKLRVRDAEQLASEIL